MHQVLAGIDGVRSIADDFIVFSKDEESHDKALERTFQRPREQSLMLSKKKCIFKTNELNFHGVTLSSKGLSADKRKIDALCKKEAPTNVSEVRSLLGMTNYVARFIPDYATITEMLKELTRKDNEWSWTDRQESAID